MTHPQTLDWRQRIGQQRDWVWRGWQTRYTFMRRSPATLPSQPLMLLHGFGASIGHWRHNISELSQQHSVYALDMLGFGASEKAATAYNIDLWVAQVYDFWRTVIRQPVVLIGNSIGSLVALAAAAAHPEMVAGVVMLSLPDLSIREETIPAVVRPLVRGLETLFTSPLVLQLLFYWVRRPQMVRPWAAIAYANPSAVTDELVEILTGPAQDRGSARAFAAILQAMIRPEFGPPVRSILPTLEIPILLIWGQQDRMIPPALGRQLSRCNPGLTLVELENAGHCPQDELPQQVNQEILQWLQTWQPRAIAVAASATSGTIK